MELRQKYDLECAATASSSSTSLPSRLLTITSSLLDSDRFSDVVFEHPSSSTKIPAHKFLLAARTDKWDGELDSGLIKLSVDVDIDGFRKVLSWMYTDKLDVKLIADEELLKVCEVSSVFKLKELLDL